MEEAKELLEKLEEMVKTIAEREELLAEADHILKQLEKLLKDVVESHRGNHSYDTIRLDGGDIRMTIEIHKHTVYVVIDAKRDGDSNESEIYTEMRKLAKGFRVPQSTGRALAILHYFVRRGAAELVKSIDKKIREEKELTEEVRRVLSEVKEALAPVVLAAKT